MRSLYRYITLLSVGIIVGGGIISDFSPFSTTKENQREESPPSFSSHPHSEGKDIIAAHSTTEKAFLSQQKMENELARLRKEVEKLKKQQENMTPTLTLSPYNENSAVPDNITVPEPSIQTPEERKRLLKDKLEGWNNTLQSGSANDIRMSDLKERIHNTIQTSSTSNDIALSSIQCSFELCKVDLIGQSQDNADLVLTLMEQGIISDGTEVFSAQNQGGIQGTTLYIGQPGKLLPSTSY